MSCCGTSCDIGAMSDEIVLQRATKSQDADTGEELLTFTSETLWAEWLPAGTRETWQARQRLGAFIEGVFRMNDLDTRPRPDGDRIVFDNRTFDIKPYITKDRGVTLEIPVVGRPTA